MFLRVSCPRHTGYALLKHLSGRLVEAVKLSSPRREEQKLGGVNARNLPNPLQNAGTWTLAIKHAGAFVLGPGEIQAPALKDDEWVAVPALHVAGEPTLMHG